jgi:sugar phosphate isomerase/epimerase
VGQNLEELRRISPKLSNLHVFNWEKGDVRRRLSEGEKAWRKYLRAAYEAPAKGITSLSLCPTIFPDFLPQRQDRLKTGWNLSGLPKKRFLR